VAVAQLHGPQAGLAAIAAIPHADKLDNHYLFHAVKGELHWRLHHDQAAAESFRRALTLAHVGPEQVHLNRMLEQVGGSA
jgi:RNA polymerase sigma-70 factor (ECF subfamily)